MLTNTFQKCSGMIAHAVVVILSACILTGCETDQSQQYTRSKISESTIQTVIDALVTKHGGSFEGGIKTGVRQVASRWMTVDGSDAAFKEFCLEHFIADPRERERLFDRFQQNLEAYRGHLHQVNLKFKWAQHVDDGPMYPVDHLFANFNPMAHATDDFFNTKIAFVALLNFPLADLATKNQEGLQWSRKKWAEVRLAEEYMVRVPAEIEQMQSEAYTKAETYIADYNIFMDHLLNTGGQKIFPSGLKLISHWGLRDELKAQYENKNGLEKQKMIQKIMERIILQEIPQEVINSGDYDWDPVQNKLFKAGSKTPVEYQFEPGTRYKQILSIFKSERAADPYYPMAPSLIDRRFNMERELSEKEVEALLVSIVSAPVIKAIAPLIQQRVGRPLQPFDIWYAGFKPKTGMNETALDERVRGLYPDVASFQKNIPDILVKLGFTKDKAAFLAQHIVLDPSRGAGHAIGAEMRTDKAHLRTRVPVEGMNYQGYNVAIHELGHTVEQVFSLNEMDSYMLSGVPNTAFTEAFAFMFQTRDRGLLGISTNQENGEALRALNLMWTAYEISGVALVDMYIWRWLYENPGACHNKLKRAVISISKDVWNKYYAPVFGVNDQVLLSIYSHIVELGMYTPDYPLGYVILSQIEGYIKNHELAVEMQRMCRLGQLTPQVWMQQAVGDKIATAPLIRAAEKAVGDLQVH
ncbi:MAG: hypothetical protein HQM16_02945 [Deltaproteobacteria bacterium]|nr:hypothetical protein [Deltaproteobacteria bacterium]